MLAQGGISKNPRIIPCRIADNGEPSITVTRITSTNLLHIFELFITLVFVSLASARNSALYPLKSKYVIAGTNYVYLKFHLNSLIRYGAEWEQTLLTNFSTFHFYNISVTFSLS